MRGRSRRAVALFIAGTGAVAAVAVTACSDDAKSADAASSPSTSAEELAPPELIVSVWGNHTGTLALGKEYNTNVVRLLTGALGFSAPERECAVTTLLTMIGDDAKFAAAPSSQVSKTVTKRGKVTKGLLPCVADDRRAAVEGGTSGIAADFDTALARETLDDGARRSALALDMTDAEADCLVSKSIGAVADADLGSFVVGGQKVADLGPAVSACLSGDRLTAVADKAAKVRQKDRYDSEVAHQLRQAELDQQVAEAEASPPASAATSTAAP